MEDKQKQIEDLAKCIYGKRTNTLDNCKRIAEQLIENAGYRKIPEGSVVLSKEENEKWLDFLEMNITKARKQAVAEVIAFIEEKDKKAGPYSIYRKLLAELKERYGVDL